MGKSGCQMRILREWGVSAKQSESSYFGNTTCLECFTTVSQCSYLANISLLKHHFLELDVGVESPSAYVTDGVRCQIW